MDSKSIFHVYAWAFLANTIVHGFHFSQSRLNHSFYATIPLRDEDGPHEQLLDSCIEQGSIQRLSFESFRANPLISKVGFSLNDRIYKATPSFFESTSNFYKDPIAHLTGETAELFPFVVDLVSTLLQVSQAIGEEQPNNEIHPGKIYLYCSRIKFPLGNLRGEIAV